MANQQSTTDAQMPTPRFGPGTLEYKKYAAELRRVPYRLASSEAVYGQEPRPTLTQRRNAYRIAEFGR